MKDNRFAFLDNDYNEIKYAIIPYTEEDFEEKGYKKLPKKVFEKVNIAFQSVPGQIAQKATEELANKASEEITKNAYKLVLKEGMHLAKSKTMKGAFKGLAYNNDNQLSTHADWIPLSLDGSLVTQAPQLALGAFNAMSIATGQYFLSQINSKLNSIESGLGNIRHFLETDKQSQVFADEQMLMNIFDNLEFILANDLEKQTTSFTGWHLNICNHSCKHANNRKD